MEALSANPTASMWVLQHLLDTCVDLPQNKTKNNLHMSPMKSCTLSFVFNNVFSNDRCIYSRTSGRYVVGSPIYWHLIPIPFCVSTKPWNGMVFTAI